ncbi:hypothetical protein Tco_0617610 [Tanacetum coccineum]
MVKTKQPSKQLRQKPGQYIIYQFFTKMNSDIEDDIMDPVMQCTTLPIHSSFSQKKLVSFVTEIHTLSIDISLRDLKMEILLEPTSNKILKDSDYLIHSYRVVYFKMLRFKHRSYNHVPAKSDSLPHTQTQAFKVNHSASRLAQVDQESQIKMIQVKEMMQDKDLKNSKSKDKGSRSRSQSMNEQRIRFNTAYPIDNVANKAVNEEMDDSLERDATTTTSLDAEHDRGTSLSGGPKRQETMGDTIAQTRSENVSELSNYPPLARGNTLQSGKDSLKLKELMDFCTKMQHRVLDLENTKTSQAWEITSLKLRVKKLEKKGGSRTHKLKRLYKIGRSARIVSFNEASLEQGVPDSKKDDVVSTTDDVAQVSTTATTVIITLEEITLAQELQELRIAKPKVKRIVFKEPVESTITTTIISSQQPSQEARLAREKDEANVALTEEWNDIQAKIKADQLLAERLQAREQEELTIEERAKLFQQLLEKRRKHFTAKRVEEQRNKPPTKAQQKNTMIIYLKNMIAFKRVNTFVDYRTEVMEENSKKSEAEVIECSSKRAGDELEQESTKKQKMDDDKETAELQRLMEVVPDEEEVAIDAIPLATKPPSIVDYKILKEGKISYF